jgi:transcriptional regulator with XRE-family HTH domain
VQFGAQLKRWRTARRLTQEALAFDAEISTRHLSFLEGEKAKPSREMVLLLGSALDLPLRDRNALLVAAGFAPAYRESPFDGPDGALVRSTLERIVKKHEPYPALVYDRRGDIVHMNDAAATWLPRLLADLSDMRVVRNVHHALLSPNGVRPFIVDWAHSAACLIERMRCEVANSVDHDPLRETLAEVMKYEGVRDIVPPGTGQQPFLPFDFQRDGLTLRTFSTLTTLGTPMDVTAQELTIESFFPSDDATERLLTRSPNET